MTGGRDKYRSRQHRALVREVLMREWDPIGVADIAEAADEYDSYVGTIYVMLMDQRASEEEISAYLRKTATQHMGLSESALLAERCMRTAEVLIEMRPQFETH